jgi:hypothetical protein
LSISFGVGQILPGFRFSVPSNSSNESASVLLLLMAGQPRHHGGGGSQEKQGVAGKLGKSGKTQAGQRFTFPTGVGNSGKNHSGL